LTFPAAITLQALLYSLFI